MKSDSSPSSGENPPTTPPPDRERNTKPLITGDGDLWDFDDDPKLSAEVPEEKPQVSVETEHVPIPVAPRTSRKDAAPFKQTPPKKPEPMAEAETPVPPAPSGAAPESAPKRPHKTKSSSRKPVEDAFEDLEDQWVDPNEPAEKAQESPEKPATPAVSEVSVPTPPAEPAPAPKPEPEFQKSLSKIEKISLVSFLVLIIAAGLFYFANSIHKLPEVEKVLTKSDFPIKGTKLEAVKFDSYWRDPVISGPNPDTVRRGTIIIPVVELEVTGGPAAVRVFFRNSDGDTVGDAVSRDVKGKSTLILPATAGFEEPATYAAYRTGHATSWKVEVFEGPSAESPGSEFKKLFEIPISTQRR